MDNPNNNNLIKQGYIKAKGITRKYAQTFYFASRFLTKDKRYAAYSIYAICRLSDETVDNLKSNHMQEELIQLRNSIDKTYNDAELSDNLLLAFQNTVNKYRIPRQYFELLLEGMQMDLDKRRYASFKELYDYCYKVAGVVGLIMLKVFGYQEPEAEKYALNLGIAMQLTNILRDIKEDFQRGRVYLPKDEMQHFKISESDISSQKLDENFKALLRFQIERTRRYYAESMPGIKFIGDFSSRFVILAMKEMYSKILDSIEKNNYDIFSKRAHVNNFGKILTAFNVFLKGKCR